MTDALERFTRGSGVAASLLGLVVLGGWILAPDAMMRLREQFLPMAPTAALANIFLGLMLALRARPASPPPVRALAWTCGAVSLAVISVTFALDAGLHPTDIDGWLGRSPSGAIPGIARVTPANLICLLVQAVLLLALMQVDDPRRRSAIALFAGVPSLLGVLFTMGYFYGYPMRPVIGFTPVGLTGALAMTLLGFGTIGLSGRDVPPLASILADSVESLLLRTFLPLTFVIVLLQGIMRQVILVRVESAILVVFTLAAFWFALVGVALMHVSRRIGQRIERMEQERTVARMQDHMKSELLASLSHKIRTPMNSVLGMAGLLQRTQLDPKQREYVEIVRSGSEGLLDLLNDILDLSRIEAGRLTLEPEPFDLAALLRSNAGMFGHLAAEKGIEFVTEITIDVPGKVTGDSRRLRQVLTNLIDNAVKFTAKGRVTVRASAAQLTPDRVELTVVVKDTGIGLSPEQLAHVFSRFAPAAEGAPRLAGGPGLGLAISHHLVQLMNGTLRVESAVGQGATFILSLAFPYEPSEATASARAEAPALPVPAPARRRILVVDDNAMNLIVASKMLEVMGHDADQAHSGREALEATKHRSYPLILMDCEMADIDGYEATRRIRASAAESPTPPDVPIVALTAHALQGHIQRCLEAGMNDIITKPVNLETLTRAVSRWLPAAPVTEVTPADAADLPPLEEVPESTRQLTERRKILEDTLGEDSTKAILKLYLETLERGIKALIEAWHEPDTEELGREAHRLKGASLNVGAQTLAGLCANLEDMARKEAIVAPKSRLEQLVEEAERVRRILDGWI